MGAIFIETTQASTSVNGYNLLTKAIAKQAYYDMKCWAKIFYKHARKNISPSRDEVAAKRSFNAVASWFVRGDFAEWYDDEMGRYLVDSAKQEAYAQVFHVRLKDRSQVWRFKRLGELEVYEVSGDYLTARKKFVEAFSDGWRVESVKDHVVMCVREEKP